MKPKERIIKENLILCEGADEYYFLIAYLNHVNTSQSHLFREDIQVMNFGGVKDLRSY